MYCKYCGKEIDANSKFCKYCGKELESASNVSFNIFSGLSLSTISALKLYVVLSVSSFLVSFFPWISVSFPDLMGGRNNYSYSLYKAVFQIGKYSSYLRDDVLCQRLDSISSGCLALLLVYIIVLLMYFFDVYYKRRAAYFKGIFLSIVSTLCCIWFLIEVGSISNEVSKNSINLINVSFGLAPVIITILNVIALFFLIKELSETPKKQDDGRRKNRFDVINYYFGDRHRL